jgi:hypothetical protein
MEKMLVEEAARVLVVVGLYAGGVGCDFRAPVLVAAAELRRRWQQQLIIAAAVGTGNRQKEDTSS